MSGARDVTDVIGYFAIGFLAYKTFELGPYEAALLFGRTVRVFIVALQGHL